MATVNYASSSLGATISSVSAESRELASHAANVLEDRDDTLWIAEAPPQYVTVRLPAAHPPLRFVGWYVWHDYLTNPKVVEVTSGRAPADGREPTEFKPVVVATALPGAGVQLWELGQNPIPADHTHVRFHIAATFGGTYAYVNRLYMFSEHPGQAFVEQAQAAAAAAATTPPRSGAAAVDVGSPTSPMHMSALLRELDTDIRQLHPLKLPQGPQRPARSGHTPVPVASLSPARNHSTAGGTTTMTTSSLPPVAPADASFAAGLHVQAQHQVEMDRRLSTLEGSVAALIDSIHAQSRDIAAMRASVEASRHDAAAAATPAAAPIPQPKHQYAPSPTLPFPEDALRQYVEDIVAPKLQRHAKRVEARLMQQVDRHLAALVAEVEATTERRVADHLRRLSSQADAGFRCVSHPHGHATRKQ